MGSTRELDSQVRKATRRYKLQATPFLPVSHLQYISPYSLCGDPSSQNFAYLLHQRMMALPARFK